MTGEQGEWTVALNDDETAVVIEFTHMGEDGVEAFETAMPAPHAIVFAAAVLNHALELTGEELS